MNFNKAMLYAAIIGVSCAIPQPAAHATMSGSFKNLESLHNIALVGMVAAPFLLVGGVIAYGTWSTNAEQAKAAAVGMHLGLLKLIAMNPSATQHQRWLVEHLSTTYQHLFS